jgi:MFS family permease
MMVGQLRPAKVVRAQMSVSTAAAASYVAFGTVLQTVPPFAEAIRHEFGASPQAAGLAMAAFLVPMLLLSFPAGRACDRRGPTLVARVGFAILLMATFLTAAAPSFPVFLLTRALAGLGSSLDIVAALKLIGIRVPAGQFGTALGVFVIGLPVGTVIAFDVVAPVLGDRQWRVAFLAAAAVVAACSAGYEAAARAAGPADRPPTENVPNAPPMRIGGSLIRLLALSAVGYAVILAFTTWAPVYVPRYAGLAPQTAVLLASVLLAIDIPAAPLWGHLSDRLGRRKPFLVYAFVIYAAGALTLPLVAGAPGPRVLWLALLIAVMGGGCAMFLPASLATMPELVPAAHLGSGYGLFITAQVTGMALGPVVFGPVFAHAGVAAGLGSIAVLSAIGALLAATIKAR